MCAIFTFLAPSLRINYFGRPPQTPAKCVYEIEQGVKGVMQAVAAKNSLSTDSELWRMLSHNIINSLRPISLSGEKHETRAEWNGH